MQSPRKTELTDLKYIRHKPTIKDVRIWLTFFLLLVFIPWMTSRYLDSEDHLYLFVVFAILGFFVFHLVVRRSLAFKSYFTSPYNLLTTKYCEELVFDFSMELAFEKVKEVMEGSKFKLVDEDRDKNELLAITRISFRSWGENLYMTFHEEDGKTLMKFNSVTFFQVYAWGKNEANFMKFMKDLDASLTV